MTQNEQQEEEKRAVAENLVTLSSSELPRRLNVVVVVLFIQM